MESQKLKVLYVDDEETNLFIFRELLKSTYEIITASFPLEALAILDSQEIDIVVTDMRMPQMNGVEFVKRAIVKHPDLPYFMLTAFENNEEINKAVEEKIINYCFIKPFNAVSIVSEVSKVMNT